MKKNCNDDDANNKLYSELLDEIIDLAVEDTAIENSIIFSDYVKEMLPQDIMNALIAITGSESFIEDIYSERFETKIDDNDDDDDVYDRDVKLTRCQICDRDVKLTRHHVYPRETHKACLKRGIHEKELIKTISICKMCHASIHRFFSNDELTKNYYSLELLLADEKVIKYAKWAATQGSRLSKIR